MSQFLVKVFAVLGLTQLNLVYFFVNSSVIFTRLILDLHSLMSQFLVEVFAVLGLTLLNRVYFLVNSSVYNFFLVNTQFTLTKEWLVLTKEQFMHIKSH